MLTDMVKWLGCAQKPKLTSRELEVLKLMALGMTNSQIAEKLVISEHTAKAHVSHILQKFSASDRLIAVVKAMRLGIIE